MNQVCALARIPNQFSHTMNLLIFVTKLEKISNISLMLRGKRYLYYLFLKYNQWTTYSFAITLFQIYFVFFRHTMNQRCVQNREECTWTLKAVAFPTGFSFTRSQFERKGVKRKLYIPTICTWDMFLSGSKYQDNVQNRFPLKSRL